MNKDEVTLIAIDGGGSKTRGILKRSNEIICTIEAGSTRIGAVGVGESTERVLNIIRDLCHRSEIDSSEVDAIVVGLAGVWLEEEKQRSTQLLKTLARNSNITINDTMITSDAEIALEGVLGGKNGIALIAGTGTITLGKINNKEVVRCGGWGIELDDEGSGAWIGREGLTAIVRAVDGRSKSTKLFDMLAERYPMVKKDRPRTIVSAYSERIFEYHSLTPMVMKCAEDGDDVCYSIIETSAQHLVDGILAVRRQFSNSKEKVEIACMGGMIENDTLLSRLLYQILGKEKNIKVVKPYGSALEGALSMAFKLLNEYE
ncbi:MAG: hypothetical protein JST20_03275 [Bacteroidetes bacterium]|nr:hypothetical protein [Bacteroidota bacterium]